MSSQNLKDEDSEDEIFVLKQIKPVNKLTLQDALIIKHTVLNSLQNKNDSTSLKKKGGNKKNNRNNENVKEKKRKAVKKSESQKNSISTSDSFFACRNIPNSPPKSSLGSPQAKSSTSNCLRVGEKTPEKEKSSTEDVRLSPGVNRKKRKFSLPEHFSPEKSNGEGTKKRAGSFYKRNISFNKSTNFNSLNREKQSLKFNDFSLDFKNESVQNKNQNESFNNKSDNSTVLNEINFMDNGTLLCFILKKIISDVTKQQLELESNEKNKRVAEKLLLKYECDILENFFKLDENLCKLFVRLLCRKNDWHRVSNLSFKDVNMDLSVAFQKLHENNFVDNKIENEDLEFQLNFFKKGEITELCKLLNIPYKSSSKKIELIKLIVQTGKQQKSIAQLFDRNKNNSVYALIQEHVKKNLGLCIRLNEAVRSTFTKLLVLFSFPHFYGEEETRLRDQLYLCMNVHKGFVKFVNYEVCPTTVFYKQVDFEEYCKALTIRENFELAIMYKKYSEFFTIADNVESELLRLLNDEQYCESFKCLEPFLKRFSAGYIFAKILTSFCETFKKQNDREKIIRIAKMLLNQRMFLSSKRGKWFEILSQAHESLKDNKSAAEVLIEALKDPCIDEVQKLTLQFRAQAILQKKSGRIADGYLRDSLEETSVSVIRNPPSIEIRGKSLEENRSGFKSVYIQETKDGKMFSSVEELALSYYKTAGFPKGLHTEGYIIHSLYALIFFDIIYGPAPLGAFQNAYQESPLDFYSKSFYLNRKEAIDLRLQEMCDWAHEEMELHIKKIYYENVNTTCVIVWKENFTPELFCEILKCISLPVFAQICRRLLENVKVAGFPDLTLWNSDTLKCKFVEVKSPNDRLSSAQRVWLDFLKKIGIDCEVCNIKNVGRKISI